MKLFLTSNALIPGLALGNFCILDKHKIEQLQLKSTLRTMYIYTTPRREGGREGGREGVEGKRERWVGGEGGREGVGEG